MFTGAPVGGPCSSLATSTSAPTISLSAPSRIRASVAEAGSVRRSYSRKFTETRAASARAEPPPTNTPRPPVPTSAITKSTLSQQRATSSARRASASVVASEVPRGAWMLMLPRSGSMSGKKISPLPKTA